MRLFWMFCLLIGGVTCGRVPTGSNVVDPIVKKQPPSSGFRYNGGLSAGSSAALHRRRLPNFKAPNGEGMAPVSRSGPPAPSGGNKAADPVPKGGFGYAGNGPHRFGSNAPQSGYDGSDQNWSSGPVLTRSPGSEAVDDVPAPVFSDVSDLDPVFTYSARSRYQRGKSVFVQTRYSPGEPAAPAPVHRPVGKTPLRHRRPKAPAKAGY